MENVFKLLGIGSLLMFSFFYINSVNNYLVQNSNLVYEINSVKELYTLESVDAVVYGEYIIPGINGKVVNLLESYYMMSPYDKFLESFVVYDTKKPNVSIDFNKDKYIERGNHRYRKISIVINLNTDVNKYVVNNNILVNKLVNISNYLDTNLFPINNEIIHFSKVSKSLSNNICVVNEYNEDICRENDYFLIKPNTYVTNDNYSDVKNDLYSGQILYIADNLTLEYFEKLYQEILFRGYEIVSLINLISE